MVVPLTAFGRLFVLPLVLIFNTQQVVDIKLFLIGCGCLALRILNPVLQVVEELVGNFRPVLPVRLNLIHTGKQGAIIGEACIVQKIILRIVIPEPAINIFCLIPGQAQVAVSDAVGGVVDPFSAIIAIFYTVKTGRAEIFQAHLVQAFEKLGFSFG